MIYRSSVAVPPPPNGNPGSNRRKHVIDPVRNSTGIKSPMGVAEIVTVCMGGLVHEMREFLPAARVAFPDVPISVYTDREGEVSLINRECPVENLTIHSTRLFDLPAQSSVKEHSVYWQKIPILCKLMAIQERAKDLPPRSTDGVLLVDCDVTFREGFERRYHGDVALSPFYWGKRTERTREGGLLQHRDGEFNAGMLLTRSSAFCDWWLRAYLSGEGGFYEQGCLDAVPGLFPTDYFSPLHNWGKWRWAAPCPAARSFHQHVAERAAARPDVGAIKIAAQRAAAEARAKLKGVKV